MDVALLVAQLVNDVILVATLVVVIVYTIKTADMADATKKMADSANQSSDSALKALDEMREARDQESAPYVVCFFDVPHGEHLIYFVVKNEGRSVAHDVRLSITPQMTTTRGALTRVKFLNDGIASLPGGSEIRTLFDSAIGLFGSKELPLRYEARITYRGGLMPGERSSEQTLDLSVFQGLLSVQRKNMDDLVGAVTGIKDGMAKVVGHLEDVSDTLKEGVLVRNPDFVVTTRSVDGSQAQTAFAAKLREFRFVWESVLRDHEREVIPFAIGLQAKAIVLSQQLVNLLSIASYGLSNEATYAAVQISTRLLEMGAMNFYIDGGASIRRFNDLGNAIVADITSLEAALADHDRTLVPTSTDPHYHQASGENTSTDEANGNAEATHLTEHAD